MARMKFGGDVVMRAAMAENARDRRLRIGPFLDLDLGRFSRGRVASVARNDHRACDLAPVVQKRRHAVVAEIVGTDKSLDARDLTHAVDHVREHRDDVVVRHVEAEGVEADFI